MSVVSSISELESIGLGLGNGGGWRRSDGPLGSIFNINREKGGGRIISVQLCGLKQNDFSGKIDKKISDKYKNDPCRILNVTGKQIEIDHKDGRKVDYKLHDNQTLNDFQPLHKSCNVAKRRHCSVCSKTGIRFNAKLLGYKVKQFIGPEQYNGSCIGCYWYDPVEFNIRVSECFMKER